LPAEDRLDLVLLDAVFLLFADALDLTALEVVGDGLLNDGREILQLQALAFRFLRMCGAAEHGQDERGRGQNNGDASHGLASAAIVAVADEDRLNASDTFANLKLC